MLRSLSTPLLSALCLLARIANLPAAEPLQVRTEGARFVGSIGCKSSSCHGGAGEKRNQFQIWSQKDFHTRAFAILTNARSQRIAETLGISAAPSSNRCTICHSPLQAVAPVRLLPTVNPTEGVSCENCHGAAEPWLRGHTRTDWKYATRVGAGMRDLRSFYVRANTCVACHQNLDSDLAAAGHPELVFEMAHQSADEPPHWRDPEGSSVRAWLVGQAVALRETSWRLAQDSAASPQTLGQWEALHWLLAKVTAADRTLLQIEADPARDAQGFARVQQQADALARRAAQEKFSNDFAPGLLRNLTEVDPEFVETSERSREQLFCQAQRLLLALESLTSGDKKFAEELRSLREDLRPGGEFQPATFATHLANLRSRLTGAAP